MVAQPTRFVTSTLRRAAASGPLTITAMTGRSAVGAFLRGGAVIVRRASTCQSANASEIDPEISVFCADADTLATCARPSATTIGAVANGILNFPISSPELAI